MVTPDQDNAVHKETMHHPMDNAEMVDTTETAWRQGPVDWMSKAESSSGTIGTQPQP